MTTSPTQSLQLTAEHQTLIRNVVASVVPEARIAVFGSRTQGRARPYSDVDLLFTAPSSLTWQQRADLTDAFEASDLPFRVDIVEADRLATGYAARVRQEAMPL